MELQQVIYHVLKTQIQFGVYRFGERLPTIEDGARLFMVSVKTIRAAYCHLQRDGYLTISKNVGVKVDISYSQQDNEAYIQRFFTEQKDALLDLGRSMKLLFGNAQWLGLKNASPELLDEIEGLSAPDERMAPYVMIRQLQAVYGVLGNDLLMRLVWQVFMFSIAPFLSISGNRARLNQGRDPFLQMTALCREGNWPALRSCVEAFQEQGDAALHQFYAGRILHSVADRQAVFTWSVYQKASQLCYSLGMEFLIAISLGKYPPGSLLPSLNAVAREKHVSVNTVRRTMALLNDIGAAKSINGVGTRVLPPEEIVENCDLSAASAHRQLFNYAKSVHILTLSCRQVAFDTLASMDRNTAGKWSVQLAGYARMRRHELTPYAIINLISNDAPSAAVRTVYTALFRSLFWGYPLRSLVRDPQSYNAFYVPQLQYCLDCLERSDAAAFSTRLEELMWYEMNFIVGQLTELGIREAGGLVLDESIRLLESPVAPYNSIC